MCERDLTIYEYRMKKEILYHKEVIRERRAQDYEKISLRTTDVGRVLRTFKIKKCGGN